MNLHTYVFFMHDAVHHFKQHNSEGYNQDGNNKGKKDKSTRILMHPV